MAVLLVFCVGLWLGTWLYQPEPTSYALAEQNYRVEVSHFVQNLPKKIDYNNEQEENGYNYSKNKYKTYAQKDAQNIQINYQNFDPNTATLPQLLGLGINVRAANSIINYREKGGKFRQPSDLQKIYTLTPAEYAKVQPYITLPSYKPKKDSIYAKREYVSAAKLAKIVEINAADSTELEGIKGVGSYIARNIIWYRNSLGGFKNVEQLQEVKSMSEAQYQEILPFCRVNAALLKKTNINQADLKKLGRHPYIGYANAKNIIAYRTAHGNFKGINDLKRLSTLDQKFVEKIQDYLEY